jgi:hypothetical protein
MRSRLLKAGACAGVALAVAVVGWTPTSSGGGRAAAQTGPPSVILRLPAQGTGLNGGQTIRVRVSITCVNAIPAPITVRIRQPRGQRVIRGVGQSSAYRCNGRTQTVPVLVNANRGFFVPGAANASGNVRVCNDTANCVNGQDNRPINLVAPSGTTTTTAAP